MKKLISIITVLFIILMTPSVFSETRVYDPGCAYIQGKIIENVLIGEAVGQHRKMSGSFIVAGAKMSMFWLKLFEMNGCSTELNNTWANTDSLTDELMKAVEK